MPELNLDFRFLDLPIEFFKVRPQTINQLPKDVRCRSSDLI